MSITPSQVIDAFSVEGSNVELSYTKYLTNTLPSVPLIISNSSALFGIQFYPTSSAGIRFVTENNIFIDENSPLTLPPKSGSNINGIKLFAVVDTTNFNTTQLSTIDYVTNFSLVAVTSSMFALPTLAGSPVVTIPTYTGGGGVNPTTEGTGTGDGSQMTNQGQNQI